MSSAPIRVDQQRRIDSAIRRKTRTTGPGSYRVTRSPSSVVSVVSEWLLAGPISNPGAGVYAWVWDAGLFLPPDYSGLVSGELPTLFPTSDPDVNELDYLVMDGSLDLTVAGAVTVDPNYADFFRTGPTSGDWGVNYNSGGGSAVTAGAHVWVIAYTAVNHVPRESAAPLIPATIAANGTA
jgi:hypothetical protein